jgi:hypothetical protein
MGKVEMIASAYAVRVFIVCQQSTGMENAALDRVGCLFRSEPSDGLAAGMHAPA